MSDNFETCAACCGDGGWEKARPQHDDPYYTVWVKCHACNGSGWAAADCRAMAARLRGHGD